MKTISRSALRTGLFVAAIAGAPAFAADIAAPALVAGDTWTYRHIDGYNHSDLGTVSRSVVSADARNIRLVSRAADGTVTEERTLNGPGMVASGMLSPRAEGPMQPAMQVTPYPLREGEKWTQHVVRSDVMSKEPRSMEIRGRVIGWETVKVPAGEFRALRIERWINLADYDSFRGPTWRWETEWYSPDVKGPVKVQVFEEYFDNRYAMPVIPTPWTRATFELVSYKRG